MPTKYIENTTANNLFVGGKMIPPGEGRDIDTALLPPEHQDVYTDPEENAGLTLHEQVAELLTKSVKHITEELPALTQEGLDLLLEQENAAKAPRKSLLGALEAEGLRRAAAAMDEQFQKDADAAHAAQMATLTPEQLAALGPKA